MAEIKISDLTPKGANLIATDLLVISEDIGGGLYETKSITGDEVLNAVAKTAVAVRNQTGVTIYKGTIVYISGTSGGKALISKAQANSEITSSKTLGVVTSDIANNANGNVLTNGLLTLLDTRTTATNPFTADTLAIGDDLYLSPTNAGYVTNVKPIAPNNLVNIGKVLETSATTGQILYAIVNGYELGELHDVDTTGAVSGNVLALNGGIWKPTTISTGLTIGTTPITSGTVGRVLFEGAGNVAQEDANFTFDSTLKKLTLKAVGTTASDIPFVVRNSADTADLLKVAGNKITLNGPSGTAFTPSIDLQRNGTSIFFIDEYAAKFNAPAYFSSIVGYGSNPIYISPQSGSLGNITLYPVSSGISLGYSSTAARLDVKAQGALSTDIALRVRNSADTGNLVELNGLGNIGVGIAASAYKITINGSSLINGLYASYDINAGGTTYGISANSAFGMSINSNQYGYQFKLNGTTRYGYDSYGMFVKNNLTPTSSIIDAFQQYSADIVAGNAAPHFRTENGSVIKLYKQDLPTNPTNAEIATLLSNLGLANLI